MREIVQKACGKLIDRLNVQRAQCCDGREDHEPPIEHAADEVTRQWLQASACQDSADSELIGEVIYPQHSQQTLDAASQQPGQEPTDTEDQDRGEEVREKVQDASPDRRQWFQQSGVHEFSHGHASLTAPQRSKR